MTPCEPGTPRSWTQGARSGSMGGDVPVGGGRTFQKAPSLHQALIPLLSKSLTFLETKDSVAPPLPAEEPVRPVCVPRKQVRAKLWEGVGALGTCSPARQAQAALLHHSRPAGPCTARLHEDTGWPLARPEGLLAAQYGGLGAVALLIHSPTLQIAVHLHPLCSRAHR